MRSVPGSRHNPQFSKAAIASALGARCIAYVHMVGLGGFRKADAGSDANAGWKNNAFRGYADYMQTPSFEESLGGLIEMAERGTVCIMCAETVPWRCHRSLLSDALTARGVEVVHIMGDGADHPHRVTDFALLEGERVTYPGEMTLS